MGVFGMVDIAVLLLVFAAVTWGVWVVTPLLAQLGLERSAGRYVKSDGRTQSGPIYRFTTPERLAQSCWSAAPHSRSRRLRRGQMGSGFW